MLLLFSIVAPIISLVVVVVVVVVVLLNFTGGLKLVSRRQPHP